MILLSLATLVYVFARSEAFVLAPSSALKQIAFDHHIRFARELLLNPNGNEAKSDSVPIVDVEALSDAEKKEFVGNLVADDEWQGLTMELSELVRVAVIEDVKKNAREFLGKDDYKVGDLSNEVDSRVKDSIAKIRGKAEYELGDFCFAMDEVSKSLTEELTGKEYEPGDLSRELDTRVKQKVAEFAGKEDANYEFGDLSREIDRRIKKRVEQFTGKEGYQIGDISIELEERRKEWVKNFLGEEAANNYRFGDITKKALSNITGMDDYEFGDITRKALRNLFGGRKSRKGDGGD